MVGNQVFLYSHSEASMDDAAFYSPAKGEETAGNLNQSRNRADIQSCQIISLPGMFIYDLFLRLSVRGRGRGSKQEPWVKYMLM